MRIAFAWLVAAVIAALVSVGGAAAAPPGGYVVHPLVSNNGVAGTLTDPHLVNAWGLAAGPATPWWVNDNGEGLATLYTAAGVKRPLEVAVGDGPTRLVFNDTSGFALKNS